MLAAIASNLSAYASVLRDMEKFCEATLAKSGEDLLKELDKWDEERKNLKHKGASVAMHSKLVSYIVIVHLVIIAVGILSHLFEEYYTKPVANTLVNTFSDPMATENAVDSGPTQAQLGELKTLMESSLNPLNLFFMIDLIVIAFYYISLICSLARVNDYYEKFALMLHDTQESLDAAEEAKSHPSRRMSTQAHRLERENQKTKITILGYVVTTAFLVANTMALIGMGMASARPLLQSSMDTACNYAILEADYGLSMANSSWVNDASAMAHTMKTNCRWAHTKLKSFQASVDDSVTRVEKLLGDALYEVKEAKELVDERKLSLEDVVQHLEGKLEDVRQTATQALAWVVHRLEKRLKDIVHHIVNAARAMQPGSDSSSDKGLLELADSLVSNLTKSAEGTMNRFLNTGWTTKVAIPDDKAKEWSTKLSYMYKELDGMYVPVKRNLDGFRRSFDQLASELDSAVMAVKKISSPKKIFKEYVCGAAQQKFDAWTKSMNTE